ncbi:hypothetical protein F5B22DRAFT_53381 [Xylaria bambusicola]|uniref:uncharacterized protein n=1 Tax=Xylaria bambusicola TaxID=326684 RepID=UPI002008295F|nr:uncharacterized protein F5B22DRAFT_53381 [Xylaria bambusicola]KAI0520813.1 hypothetical protein F5B22DRAFT_53381 [Xylaria bambusicola]
MAGKGSSSSSNPVPGTTPSPPAVQNPAAGSQSILKQRRPGGSTAVLPAGGKKPAGSVVGKRAKGSPLHANNDDIMPWTKRNAWVVYAVASGACAAFNGVFAKLTTDNLTAHIARGISGALGLEGIDGFLEIIVRGAFFGLNILFNIIMWTLFTKALAKGNSTTQVSIMNTSTNFMISALLGLAIFAESLPPLWWAGATLLVAGNVILGRKEVSPEEDMAADAVVSVEPGVEAAEQGHGEIALPDLREEELDEDVPLLGDLDDSSRNR